MASYIINKRHIRTELNLHVAVHEDVNSSNRIVILLQCCQQIPVKLPLGLSSWLQIGTLGTILLNWTSRRMFSKRKITFQVSISSVTFLHISESKYYKCSHNGHDTVRPLTRSRRTTYPSR
jgi:hypothetical protein